MCEHQIDDLSHTQDISRAWQNTFCSLMWDFCHGVLDAPETLLVYWIRRWGNSGRRHGWFWPLLFQRSPALTSSQWISQKKSSTAFQRRKTKTNTGTREAVSVIHFLSCCLYVHIVHRFRAWRESTQLEWKRSISPFFCERSASAHHILTRKQNQNSHFNTIKEQWCLLAGNFFFSHFNRSIVPLSILSYGGG